METLFLICAIGGGTILICQFAMTLLGLGGHDVGMDHGGGLGHFDAGHDAGHDSGGSHGAPQGDDHEASPQHSSNWLFGVITFRTVVAAIAFFGLGGMAALSNGVPPAQTLWIALACGAAAMYGVFYLMQTLRRFDSDGTIRIDRAVGLTGTVYLPIPAANAGAGKVHLKLQNRLVEYQAMTSHDRIPSGATITVVGVLGPDLVEVAPAVEAERNVHV